MKEPEEIGYLKWMVKNKIAKGKLLEAIFNHLVNQEKNG